MQVIMKILVSCGLALACFLWGQVPGEIFAQNLVPDPEGDGIRHRISGSVINCYQKPATGVYVGLFIGPINNQWILRDETLSSSQGVWKINSQANINSSAIVAGKDGYVHSSQGYFSRVATPRLVGVNGEINTCNGINCGFTKILAPLALPQRFHYYASFGGDVDHYERFFVSLSNDAYARGFDFVQVANRSGVGCTTLVATDVDFRDVRRLGATVNTGIAFRYALMQTVMFRN